MITRMLEVLTFASDKRFGLVNIGAAGEIQQHTVGGMPWALSSSASLGPLYVAALCLGQPEM